MSRINPDDITESQPHRKPKTTTRRYDDDTRTNISYDRILLTPDDRYDDGNLTTITGW